MSIYADMQPALTEAVRVRAMVAQGMTGAAVSARLGAALDVLEEAARRVLALEGGPVPSHWRKQRAPSLGELDGAVIVSLHEARMVRRGLVNP
ncbi:MAG: hypothetical protein ACOVNS_03700 [Erythrobacter sp.]|jgi:hypothetical protein